MNYPHVEKLYYRVITPEYTDYDGALPISGETPDFIWSLGQDQLAIQMKTHCETENEATGIVDEFLRGWEISAGLLNGPESLVFRLDSSVTLDRPSNNHRVVNPDRDEESSIPILLADEERGHVLYDKFPSPPQNFRASPEVEMMFIRYKLYRQGRETLLGLAHWCLTVIEYSARGRKEAADQYLIDNKVLRKLGDLCGNREYVGAARKFNLNGSMIPLKPAERVWIRAVVKRLIIRAGEYAYGPVSKMPMITMAEFPSLSEPGGQIGSDKRAVASGLQGTGRPSGTGLYQGD